MKFFIMFDKAVRITRIDYVGELRIIEAAKRVFFLPELCVGVLGPKDRVLLVIALEGGREGGADADDAMAEAAGKGGDGDEGWRGGASNAGDGWRRREENRRRGEEEREGTSERKR